MTFDEYEKLVTRTMNPGLDEKDRLMDAAAGLAEESGEILGLVRKHMYQSHELPRERLRTELGDALWCLTVAARGAGLSLEEVAAGNVAKLEARYPEGYSDRASRERRS